MENIKLGLKHPSLHRDIKRTFEDAFEDVPGEGPNSDSDAPVSFPSIENNISHQMIKESIGNLDANAERLIHPSHSLVPVVLLDLVEEERRGWSSERQRQKRIKMEHRDLNQLESNMFRIPLRPKSLFVAAPGAEPQLQAKTEKAGLPIRARMSSEDHSLPLLKDPPLPAVSALSSKWHISKLTSALEVEGFGQNIQTATPHGVGEKYTRQEKANKTGY